MSVATKLDEKRHLTYEDYIKWDTPGERWELIDGEAYAMASPNAEHQRISRRLARKLYGAFPEGGRCEVFTAPFDVRLNADTWDDTVVQPDIIVVCDPSKLNDNGCKGAPDLVIEIISPSTGKHDRTTKLKLYKFAGTREYWIIDPTRMTVDVHVFETGENNIWHWGDEVDNIPVHVLEGLEISMDSIFDKIPKSQAATSHFRA